MASPSHRIVVVLGREGAVSMDEHAHEVLASRAELVILSLGFPPSYEQRTSVEAAIQWAARGGIAIEARICYTTEEAATRIQNDDRLVLVLSPKESKHLERCLGRSLDPSQ